MYDLNQVKLEFLVDTAERIENVSDQEYFGGFYKGYVSNSLLALINPEQGGAPTKFLSGFESTKSGALELGSAVHQMILEKDKYFLSPVDKPSGKIGLICDTYHQLKSVESEHSDEVLLTMACIEHDYYKGKLTDKKLEDILLKGKEYLDHLEIQESTPGCIVLTEVQKQKLDGCLTSVKNNALIMNLLVPEGDNVQSYNEDVMVMKVRATMPSDDEMDFDEKELLFDIKAKIDNWTIDFDKKVLTLNDLKSTGTPLNQFGGTTFEAIGGNGKTYSSFQKGSFQKFHYYRQMAMYGFILTSYAQNAFGIDETWDVQINMLVVETNEPYMSHVFNVGENWMETGMHEFKSLLKRLSYHKVHGFDKFVEMDLTQPTEIC